MSLTNYAEQAMMNLVFRNLNWSSLGDATGLQGSTANGSLYISLHTADPGEAGDQTTSETSYTPYARVGVFRGSNNFLLTGSTISNLGTIAFPQCTSGTATITHFGIGTDSSGGGNLIMKGNLSASLAVSTGIAPTFAVGALTATVD